MAVGGVGAHPEYTFAQKPEPRQWLTLAQIAAQSNLPRFTLARIAMAAELNRLSRLEQAPVYRSTQPRLIIPSTSPSEPGARWPASYSTSRPLLPPLRPEPPRSLRAIWQLSIPWREFIACALIVYAFLIILVRLAGCGSIAAVHFAVLENNGQISVRVRDR